MAASTTAELSIEVKTEPTDVVTTPASALDESLEENVLETVVEMADTSIVEADSTDCIELASAADTDACVKALVVSFDVPAFPSTVVDEATIVAFSDAAPVLVATSVEP